MRDLIITPVVALAEGERAAVADLLAAAEARDGIAHGISTEPPAPDAPIDDAHYLLAREGGAIVGVVGLVGYQEVEATIVVHPDHRRRGIGSRLIAATQAELARRKLATWLLVSDAAAGTAPFAAAVGGTLDFSEHRLRLDPARLPAPAPTSILISRLATPADTADLASLIAAAFGDPIADVREWVAADFAADDRRWFIASVAQAPVGTLRVRLVAGEGAYVTGFGIAPAYQNQRLGRQFLLTILAMLRAEGHDPILIEVETTNAPANALYRAVGFDPIRTFGYYRMGGED